MDQLTSTAFPDLNTHQFNAIRLKFQDKTYNEIASLIGMKAQTIRAWFSKTGKLYQCYQVYCDRLLAPSSSANLTVAERIKDEAGKCVDTVIAVRDGIGTEASDKLRASFGILDRAGYGPIQKNLNINADMEDGMTMSQLNDEIDTILSKYSKAPVSPSDASPVSQPYIEVDAQPDSGTVASDKATDDTVVGDAVVDDPVSPSEAKPSDTHTEARTHETLGGGVTSSDGLHPSHKQDPPPQNVVNDTKQVDKEPNDNLK